MMLAMPSKLSTQVSRPSSSVQLCKQTVGFRRLSGSQSQVSRSRVVRAGRCQLAPVCHLNSGFGVAKEPRKRNWAIHAASTAPTPEAKGLGAIIESFKKSFLIWVINTYLNLFGGEAGINLLVQKGFPSKMRNIFKGLYQCYKAQVVKKMNGDLKKASSKTAQVFREMIRAYAGQIIGESFVFPSYHQAIREGPIDYFQLGNDYTGTLINYDQSVLGQKNRWDDVEKKINAGENVILLANHQSEADAAFIPLLTQDTHPGLGEKVIYVAGGRVVEDIMSKPFSMGRNLLCVNSKKHMMVGDRSAKMRQNIRTLKEMEKLLKAGGALIWIAPSGGRDRASEDGTLVPDVFDADAIEMMRKFGTKKGAAPTSFYPMAMATYDIMPPPTTVGGDVGEERIVNYSGVGISLAKEVDVNPETAEWAKGIPTEDHKKALADHVYSQMFNEYQTIDGCMISVDKEFAMPAGAVKPRKEN